MLSKKEFLNLLASRSNRNKKEVEEFCNILSDVLLETLKKDKKFKFLDLGTWTLKHRPAKIGINPRTKESVQIPAKEVLKFKASNNTSEFFNQ